MIDLSGQRAIVTGGGRGLGRAFAQALASAGASVTVVGRARETLDETVAAIGAGARALVLDVTNAESVAAVFREVGPVDLLVNNAGIFGPIGPFAEVDFEEWWRVAEVNLRGAMRCVHAVLPGMLERRGGRIINLVTGAFSAPYVSAYLISKTALVRATECLAAEAQPYGVTLFSVAPGSVKTDMATHSLTSTEGQEWIPWFQRIYDEGLDLPAERPAALVTMLASGRYDALTGLYLTPFDDLDEILADLAGIERDRLHTLQLRPKKVSETAAAIGAIRAMAAKPRIR